ncbi:hypothetical protein BB560_002245 [Smittium megazygosporum]|uniref:BHLH domain-containing protein n=1 Tax=Smittium megazygosporum TaxID=133381 RepID=A0A2T9ZFA8_9FUNG|nr:hypothetical protein BB560_002245 [Smittium megazygosporum]
MLEINVKPESLLESKYNTQANNLQEIYFSTGELSKQKKAHNSNTLNSEAPRLKTKSTRIKKNRQNHNELEKKVEWIEFTLDPMRHHQKKVLYELKDSIPSLSFSKPSTVFIMQKAKEYIEYLRNRSCELEIELLAYKNRLLVYEPQVVPPSGYPIPNKSLIGSICSQSGATGYPIHFVNNQGGIQIETYTNRKKPDTKDPCNQKTDQKLSALDIIKNINTRKDKLAAGNAELTPRNPNGPHEQLGRNTYGIMNHSINEKMEIQNSSIYKPGLGAISQQPKDGTHDIFTLPKKCKTDFFDNNGEIGLDRPMNGNYITRHDTKNSTNCKLNKKVDLNEGLFSSMNLPLGVQSCTGILENLQGQEHVHDIAFGEHVDGGSSTFSFGSIDSLEQLSVPPNLSYKDLSEYTYMASQNISSDLLFGINYNTDLNIDRENIVNGEELLGKKGTNSSISQKGDH